MANHQINDSTPASVTNSNHDAATLSHLALDTMKEGYNAVRQATIDLGHDIDISFKDVFAGNSTTKEKLIVAGVVAGGSVVAAAAAEVIAGAGIISGPVTESVAVLGVAVTKVSPILLREAQALEEGLANGPAKAMSEALTKVSKGDWPSLEELRGLQGK